MIPVWIFGVGIVVIALGLLWGVRNQINGLVGGGDGMAMKPTIWWYVDDSQVNARHWLDWGARATREPNEPYLALCQRRATELWGPGFQVTPIIGRVAAMERLGPVPDGADRAPPALWMPWCRAAFLAKFGGLWVDGSVLPIGSARDLKDRLAGADAMMFGYDPVEELSADSKAVAAGTAAGWAMRASHPVWSALERDLAALIAVGDQSWSAPEARHSLRWLWDKHCSGTMRVDRKAEVSRDRYGRRLELDVLLGQTEWVDGSTEGALWVPLPDGRDGLERASPWLWFTRMSEEQIRESDFVWARLATRSVS
jgi:hypothetical protein